MPRAVIWMLLRCRAADSHLSIGWSPNLRKTRGNPVVLAWSGGLKAFLDYEGVLLDAGHKIQLHHNGIAIEGEWAPVFKAIEACHTAVNAMGCSRIYTTVKVNTRTDRDQTLEDKVASVEALLQQLPARGQ